MHVPLDEQRTSLLYEQYLDPIPNQWLAYIVLYICLSALQLAVEENEDWFGVSGMIHIDGHKLPLIDLLRAMKAGRRVVSLGQGLFARISDEFYDRLLAIGDVVHQTSQGLEIDITAAPVLSQLVDIKESLQLCETWKKLLSSLDPSTAVERDPPISLSAELREYQLDGFRWMMRLSKIGRAHV